MNTQYLIVVTPTQQKLVLAELWPKEPNPETFNDPHFTINGAITEYEHQKSEALDKGWEIEFGDELIQILTKDAIRIEGVYPLDPEKWELELQFQIAISSGWRNTHELMYNKFPSKKRRQIAVIKTKEQKKKATELNPFSDAVLDHFDSFVRPFKKLTAFDESLPPSVASDNTLALSQEDVLVALAKKIIAIPDNKSEHAADHKLHETVEILRRAMAMQERRTRHLCALTKDDVTNLYAAIKAIDALIKEYKAS